MLLPYASPVPGTLSGLNTAAFLIDQETVTKQLTVRIQTREPRSDDPETAPGFAPKSAKSFHPRNIPAPRRFHDSPGKRPRLHSVSDDVLPTPLRYPLGRAPLPLSPKTGRASRATERIPPHASVFQEKEKILEGLGPLPDAPDDKTVALSSRKGYGTPGSNNVRNQRRMGGLI